MSILRSGTTSDRAFSFMLAQHGIFTDGRLMFLAEPRTIAVPKTVANEAEKHDHETDRIVRMAKRVLERPVSAFLITEDETTIESGYEKHPLHREFRLADGTVIAIIDNRYYEFLTDRFGEIDWIVSSDYGVFGPERVFALDNKDNVLAVVAVISPL